MDMYQVGRELGQMTHELKSLSKGFADHETRIGKAETKINLIFRGGIVGALWIGSTTGQLNHNEISAGIANLIKRFLIGF
ncbi:MAG TPA: hypothetical protein DCG72_11210 [Gammaproteobacteria bacterium]|nr:hypothetical protein [Gammaproteobacteria bacterium]